MRKINGISALLLLLALLGLSACTGGGEVVKPDDTLTAQKESMKDDIEKAIGIKREALDAFDQATAELDKDKPDLAKAEDLLKKALAASPQFLEAQYNLGIVFERRGQYDNAIAAYQKAQELDRLNTHSVPIQLAVGRAQALANRPDDALRTFEATVRLAPENIDVLNSLAAAYVKAGKNEDAIEYVQKVLREDNQNVTALNTLAQVYTNQDNRSMAIYVFKKAARVALGATTTDEELQAEPAVLVIGNKIDLKKVNGPTAAAILNNLGMIYFKMGELPLAVFNFNAASLLDVKDVQSRLNTAAIYLRYLNYEAAGKLFSEALSVAPDNCSAVIGLAAARFAQGQHKDALGGYQAYLDRCDQKHAISHLQLEQIYEKQQDIPNAVKHCELYVQLVKPGEGNPSVTADYCKALSTTTPRTEPQQPEGGEGGEGGAPEGGAPEGGAPEGGAPEGDAPPGDAPEGEATPGQ